MGRSCVRWALFAVLLVGGCGIRQDVLPVIPSTELTALCIESNDAVLMDEFEPLLVSLIQARGIETRLYSGPRPGDCRYAATYTAHWRWDLALYLSYVCIEVLDGSDVIGSAIYDGSMGKFNLDRFGPTEGKLKVLIAHLFPA